MEPEKIGAAIRAFMAELCSTCGSDQKALKDPFCAVCWDFLTNDLKENILDKTKYISTYHRAAEHIKKHRSSDRPEDNEPSGASAEAG